MNTFSTSFGSHSKLAFGSALALMILAGCESNPGSVSTSVGFYYGTGFYDPWYYGGAYYPPDVIVTPPPENPGNPGDQPRPEHPIANPPPVPDRPTVQPQPVRPSAPAARPMPSIPTTPRAAPRGGGRR